MKNELLLPHVKQSYIRPDKTIHPEAYSPREKETETGFEPSDSTALKSCYPTNYSLEVHKNKLRRCVLYEINSNFPNDRGYPCINDHDCHVGITGDMAKLNSDYQTLEILATNSKRLNSI